MRVHQLAKELNIDNKTLIAKLKRLGISVKNHLSQLEADAVELAYGKLRKKPAKKAGQKKEKKTAQKVKKTKKKSEEKTKKEPKEKPKKPAQKKVKKEKPKKEKVKKKAGKKPAEKKPKKPKVIKVKEPLEKPKEVKKKEPKGPPEEKLPAGEKVEEKVKPVPVEPAKVVLEFKESPTVAELARQIGIKPSELIKNLMFRGVMAAINQRLDKKLAVVVAKDFGVEAKAVTFKEEDISPIEKIEDKEEQLQFRPPVITIMGHVDHGKTTLLDAIRQSKIVEGEAGEITQHIGAYEVHLDKGKVVFLDTPGHEAFTAMRAHGAKITDIVILVVAGDDGVMPQTVEAVDHARAAKVPIVVAINKMDKPDVDSARIKKALTEYELIAEEWGGKTIFVNVSAKTGKGLDKLLEMILLEAEMLELKANPDRNAEGTVIEAEVHKGKGAIATILVQKGTLRTGDIFICGAEYGRVKAMINDQGRRVKEAGPSTPVEVLGFSNLPPAGELFNVVNDEKKARQISLLRKEKKRENALKGITHLHLEDLHKEIKAGKIKELTMILKADVLGSVTAIKESLGKIGAGKVKIRVIHSGAGGINESDVILAAASNAIIFGFNVVPDAKARALADKDDVDIHIYRVIYELLNEVKSAMVGLLEPTYKKVFSGRAEIRQIFRLPKAGMIAGAYLSSGKIARNHRVQIIRHGTIIHEGGISSLRRFKDDVKEVGVNLEFGIGIANFNDLKVGDLIEAHHLEKVAPVL